MIPEKLTESLTFDDVLLVPAESSILPRDVDVSTQLTRTDPAEYPPAQRGHGHGDRGADGHRHGPGGGDRDHPPEHVRSKRRPRRWTR